ncbi:MAG TPA: SDR family oxidoreductase [Chthoniobacterales bacterium]
MIFFEGCTALITGASAGLGTEFARQLAPYARTLVLVARRQERLELLTSELTGLFPNLQVRIYPADLSSESQRETFIRWLGEQNLEVDFLINNAGLGDRGKFATSEWDKVRQILDVNIAALTHLTHALVPGMAARGRAAILNVSSVAGFFPLPNFAVYAATKAYVTSFTEALRLELRPKGISITALCPGPVPTEFFDVAARGGGARPHYESIPAFAATPQEVVSDALRAVSKDRPRVIPNPLLSFAVGLALLLPFFIVRRVLASKAVRR